MVRLAEEWVSSWPLADPYSSPLVRTGRISGNLTEMLRQRGNRVVTNEQFAHWSYAFTCFIVRDNNGTCHKTRLHLPSVVIEQNIAVLGRSYRVGADDPHKMSNNYIDL